jgi:hypothetical protein
MITDDLERLLRSRGVVKSTLTGSGEAPDASYCAIVRLRNGHSIVSTGHATVDRAIQRILGMLDAHTKQSLQA